MERMEKQHLPASSIDQAFLLALLDAAAPSGRERRAADVWRQHAEKFARVSEDHYGNLYAEIGPEGAPAVVTMGHLDEIGVIVTNVTKEGLVQFLGVGGWDSQVLVGQRIRLLAPGGDIIGVIGKRPIHVMTPEDRNKVSKISDLWIDIGQDGETAEKLVPVGTYGVIEQQAIPMGDRIASRALDNRAGAFAVLEALRKAHESGTELKHRIIAVGTSQEEIGLFGATIAAHHTRPVAGLAVDVCHDTDQDGVEAKTYGKSALGSGANLAIGPSINPVVAQQMADLADKNGVMYTWGANGRATHTDGDAMALSRNGVPTGVVSIPTRYMHSPSEMIDLRDLAAVIEIIAAWTLNVDVEDKFIRR